MGAGQSNPDISVVIPVLNGARTIGACLDAIAAQGDAPAWEVLIVDNGSSDGTQAVVSAHPSSPTLLREGARGPYAARNTGARCAQGAVIAFTDADCIPEPGWLAAGWAATRAGADLVGGRIVQIASASPSLWERYDRAVYLRQEEYVTQQGFAATANLFVRAEAFSRLGGFRPELVASGDLEFGRRAIAAGLRLAYAESARIRHRPRKTFRETWGLHRKLGSGFSELARAGLRGPARHDPALRLALGDVANLTEADGPRVRRRYLVGVHLVAMSARWVGRLTGRG